MGKLNKSDKSKQNCRNNMNFVIPMAGLGSRFTQAGYKTPKWMISTHGKTLLEWSVSSLPLELCTRLIFIVLKEHQKKYKVREFIKHRYGNLDKTKIYIFELDNPTCGQAETVYKSQHLVDRSKDLLIYNIDTCFESKSLKEDLCKHLYDGILVTFKSKSLKFSYAVLDKKGFVVKTAEKEVLSENALCGLYHFKDPNDFFVTCKEYISKEKRTKGEFYIAPMYNDLIKQGKVFTLTKCNNINILGTPEDLESFNSKVI